MNEKILYEKLKASENDVYLLTQRINKALVFIDIDKHISTNWDNLSNDEKDEFVLDLLNEIENILKGETNEEKNKLEINK